GRTYHHTRAPVEFRGRFFFQAEDGIRDKLVTGVQTCALPISRRVVLPTRLIVRESSGAGGSIHPAELEDVFGRPPVHVANVQLRSEERRVGKECRTQGSRRPIK